MHAVTCTILFCVGVTRFVEELHLVQLDFSNNQVFGNFLRNWANFNFLNWPKFDKPSGHTVERAM